MTRSLSIATTLALALGLAACGCSPAPTTGPSNAATAMVGSAMPLPNSAARQPPVVAPPMTCDGIAPKLDQLYRAEAQVAEPKRVDERTADNVHMVLLECAKDPAKVVACVDGAATLKDIESQCLAPIDDEGTEGVRLAGSGK